LLEPSIVVQAEQLVKSIFKDFRKWHLASTCRIRFASLVENPLILHQAALSPEPHRPTEHPGRSRPVDRVGEHALAFQERFEAWDAKVLCDANLQHGTSMNHIADSRNNHVQV
jgi:hypothetical protein